MNRPPPARTAGEHAGRRSVKRVRGRRGVQRLHVDAEVPEDPQLMLAQPAQEEAPIGVGDDLRSIGLGMYPLNLQAPIGRTAAIYGSAGASASWLDRVGPGDIGALVTLRVAIGARVAKHVMFEVGYNAYALGGNVNADRIADMAEARMLGEPDKAVSAGEARGIVDASVGFAF